MYQILFYIYFVSVTKLTCRDAYFLNGHILSRARAHTLPASCFFQAAAQVGLLGVIEAFLDDTHSNMMLLQSAMEGGGEGTGGGGRVGVGEGEVSGELGVCHVCARVRMRMLRAPGNSFPSRQRALKPDDSIRQA